jgi:SPP1 gp7 family putative phage head morphogenesis protein
MKDMDFPNLQSAMMNKILAGFRVPRTVLGITDDVNRANAEATDYVFAARTIKPKMKMICTYLNEFLVPRYGSDLYLSFKDPVPENRQLKIEEMKAATGGQPVMSVNEAREEYFGLTGIDKGDAVMTDFSKVPLGEPKPKQINEQSTKKRGPGKVSSKGARISKARNEIAENIANKVKLEIEHINKRANESREKALKNGIHTLSDDDFEPIYKQFISRVDRYEKLLSGKIRDYNDTQKAIVLENLEQAAKDIDPKELYDEEEQVRAFIDLGNPILTELFKEEAAAAAVLIGSDAPLPKEVMDAIKESVKLLAKKYNETTLAALEQKLNEALADGASINELKNTVSDIYEWSNQTRAEMVAKTETFRVANSASKEAWKQAGVVKTIKWYTAADERVCQYCGPMHGKVIAIDEKFFEKGDELIGTEDGKLRLDYSDIEAPPLHVDCRCTIRPEEISLE